MGTSTLVVHLVPVLYCKSFDPLKTFAQQLNGVICVQPKCPLSYYSTFERVLVNRVSLLLSVVHTIFLVHSSIDLKEALRENSGISAPGDYKTSSECGESSFLEKEEKLLLGLQCNNLNGL